MADHPDRRAADSETVVLEVPAVAGSLRILRLAAADVAAGVGFPVEGIERAALVVDELSSLLVADGRSGRLRVEFSRDSTAVHVTGRADTGVDAFTPRLDPIASELVEIGVGRGSWRLSIEHGRPCFTAVLVTPTRGGSPMPGSRPNRRAHGEP